MQQDFERLGAFYLGRECDPATGKETDDLILYDSRDLTTHGVCIGMTGSGKTGLCLALLEEAAIDGIPVIAIDPKGDLPNLLLTFPDLAPQDFRPWINEEDAHRKGVSPDDYAAQQAALWRDGLAEWGQAPERIRRLRDSAGFRIYTPGSTAGLPVSALGSFAAPPAAIRDDAEALNERATAVAASLLGLVGVEADPLNSREHILLAAILAFNWHQGRDLDLATIIAQIQTPPIAQAGVMPIDSFFPPKDRFTLATTFNNLLASPTFAAWREGQPLDIPSILRAPDGKPAVSIFSIAHLDDTQRMFFVSLLLDEIITWMRAQPGTTSLRAILYMDEVAGYLPPVANPPSKAPLLLLLKQARAFGVGLLLATQNPVDLDYKALSNTGTWFIGRLQTERDKARVLEALQGASSGAGAPLDADRIDALLSGLRTRVFLLHNTREDAPTLFTSRWAMSYLRGPLTRDQIRSLVVKPAPAQAPAQAAAAAQPAAPAPAVQAPPQPTPVAAAPAATMESGAPPVLSPDILQIYLPVASPRPDDARLVYRPAVLASGSIQYHSAKYSIDTPVDLTLAAPLTQSSEIDWDKALPFPRPPELPGAPPAQPATFVAPPTAAGTPKSYTVWKRDFAAWLHRTRRLTLLRSPATGLLSNPDENERDFRARLAQQAREGRDALLDELRQKHATKIAALQEKVARARDTLAQEESQARRTQLSSALTLGSTILGVILGRKRNAGIGVRAAQNTVRGVGGLVRPGDDVGRAKESLQTREQELETLSRELQQEMDQLRAKTDPLLEPLEPISIAPTKARIAVSRCHMVWLPHWRTKDGALSPAWPVA